MCYMKPVIRKAKEDDREKIACVFAEAFYKDWKMLSKDLNVISKALAEGLNLNYYYVAEKEDIILGFIAVVEKEERAFSVPIKAFKKYFGFFKGYMMGMALKSEFNESLGLPIGTSYIDVLGVAKDAQGQGIGTELIKQLVKTKRANSFTLTVTNINEAAIHCYKKNGFIEYDRKPVKYAKQKGFSEMVYMKLDVNIE